MSVTFEISDDLSAELARYAEQTGKSPAEFTADALRRQLAIEQFRETRARLVLYGEATGLQTDEAISEAVS